MRILYFLQDDGRTGARTAGVRLAKALEGRGHEVFPVVAKPLGIDNEKPFVADGDLLRPTHDLVSAAAALDPDAAVVHAVTQEMLDAAPTLSSLTTILLRFGMNLTESHLNGYDTHLEALPAFVRSFDAVLSPSRVTTEKAVSLGVERERVYEVLPAADHGDPEEHGERPAAVGCPVRGAKVKNLPMVARAIRWYEDQWGRAPRVVLANGNDPAEDPTMRHARALSVDHLFEHVGWVDPFEEVYPRVRAVALSSLSENQPAVYSEALAAGVPIVQPVAAWSGGPGRFDPDSPASMARALRRAMAEPASLLRQQREWMPEAARLEEAAERAEEALVESVSRCARFKMGAGA